MSTEGGFETPVARLGRTPSTSQAELSHVALQLFVERGFDATTIDDIAAAAGIGRRTFFRYFPSKNDLPWGDFDGLVQRMRAYLHELPPELSLLDALRAAIVEFNRFPPEEVPYHRRRMALLLNVPTLQAHSTLRYAEWREVIAEFVAERRGVSPQELEPQATGWAFLAVSLSAYEQWLKDDDAELPELLDASLAVFEATFGSGGR
jgi:mycofactocin system transcriptional regulator